MSVSAAPVTMLEMPAQYAAVSHMRQGRDVDTSTQPERSRVRRRRAASRIASISAWAVGSVAVTTRLGASPTISLPRSTTAP